MVAVFACELAGISSVSYIVCISVDSYFEMVKTALKGQPVTGNIAKLIDNNQNLTVFILTGDVGDFQLIVNTINDYYAGEVTKFLLWDMTHADISGLSSEQVYKIAELPLHRPERRQGGKNAIVAPDHLAFGLSRIYETVTDLLDQPFETRVFRSREEACAWLGIVDSDANKSPIS